MECVVFHCPQDEHILFGCPPDLVRFEAIVPNHYFAQILCMRLADRYAPKNPSGYPATVYKYCTMTQWKEYLGAGDQLTFF